MRVLLNAISIFLLSLFLLGTSLLIWLFLKGSGTSLKDVLFCVGAAPIGLFAVAQIGNFKGRGDHTVQLSNSVSNQSLQKRAVQDMHDIKSYFRSGFCWFVAGLLIWVGLYIT